jgi:hypothetical protein
LKDELEFAWACGLYEGEGTAGVFSQGGNNYVTCIQVVMADAEPLWRFCAAVGMGSVHGPYNHGKGKALYRWRVNKQTLIVEFFDRAWPYLSERRRAQATPLIAHCRDRLAARQGGQ